MLPCGNVDCETHGLVERGITLAVGTVPPMTVQVPLCPACLERVQRWFGAKQPVGYSVGCRPER